MNKEGKVMKNWSENEEVKKLTRRILSSQKLTKQERIKSFWEKFSTAIRPGIEADDRCRRESMAKSFMKVVRAYYG